MIMMGTKNVFETFIFEGPDKKMVCFHVIENLKHKQMLDPNGGASAS